MRRQQFSCGRGSIRRATVFLAIVALIATASPALAARPALSIANAQVTEPDTGTTPAKLKVSLSKKSTKPITVKFKTVDRSAKAGDDYVAKDGTLKFPAGTKSKIIKVAVKSDDIDEKKNEVFLVKLSNSKGASIDDGSAKVKIADSDPLPAMSIADAAATEGAAALFEVTLSHASSRLVTVDYATFIEAADTASPGDDFEEVTGVLEFAPGDTSEQIVVPTTNDNIDENDETFTATLSVPTNATLADDKATGTISDDDGEPAMSIADAQALEGTNVAFEVTLSNATSKLVTVDYTTSIEAADTASGNDFQHATGVLEFAPGSTSQAIAVATTNDNVDELNETFTVTLSPPTNATVADDKATGTIIDNEDNTVSIANAAGVTEGSPLQFQVTLARESDRQVTVNYNVALGFGTEEPDISGPTSGQVSFAPGDTSETISVATVDDTIDEDPENIHVNLSGATHAQLGNPSASGTINDNDAAPTLTIGNAGGNEGTFITFTVTKTGLTEKIVTISASTAEDTTNPTLSARAAAGSDYQAKRTDFTFGPDEMTKFFSVTTNDDQIDELNETFRAVLLSNPVNATLGSPSSAVGTIIDTDPAPSVTVESKRIGEGLSASVGISLSHASSQDMTLDIIYTDGTAVGSSDYVRDDRTVTIPAGQTQTSVNAATIHDTEVEGNETFTIGVTNLSGTSGTITIVDDDDACSTC